MGLTVKDFLESKIVDDMRLVCGKKGLENNIKGVTIIEAPDIVKWINGGELLLTGLYAFRFCSLEEFRNCLQELKKKHISGIILKKGRNVELAEEKTNLLMDFAENNRIPFIEVPFEVSLQMIMTYVMEHISNEEVINLKFYKTTRDNFSALVINDRPTSDSIRDVLIMLEQLIRNPVAIFDENNICLGTTDETITTLEIKRNAKSFEPGMYSKHMYLQQMADCKQYIVQTSLSYGKKLYLLVTEKISEFGSMDCIAIENALVTLQYEFARQHSLHEVEKKFQSDIMHNILNGKIVSMEELKKNTRLLGLPIYDSYRVLVLGAADNHHGEKSYDVKLKYAELLEKTVRIVLPDVKIYRDMEKVIVIQRVDEKQRQEEYRCELKRHIVNIQERIRNGNKYLKLKAGVGKVVQGVVQLPKSYKEADDAFLFVDIAGEVEEENGYQLMLFSDLGIFKLLCQLDDPNMLLEYVPESLQKLYDYKKPQRDDLIITLKTYLNRNQNLSKTAQDLYVHYKTASYRIEKIAKITGMDFDNANEILAVRIGLVVYKMIENYQKKIL